MRRQSRGPNGGATPQGTAGTGNVLLADVAIELRRAQSRSTRPMRCCSPTPATAGSDGPLTPGDGKVTTRSEFDRLGRRTRVLDDNAHQTRLEYDGADRLVLRTDELGNTSASSTTPTRNVVTTVETERSPQSTVPAETFTTRTTFDSLDRATSVTDNLGNVTVSSYDSRNNRVRVQDALGNRTVRVYDGRNRLLEERSELRVSGTGGGTLDAANPANPDGLLTNQLEWDGNSRLSAVVDDRGNRTAYDYDALDRRTLTTFADGTTARSEYDRDDNLVRTTDQNGTVVVRRFDGVNRAGRRGHHARRRRRRHDAAPASSTTACRVSPAPRDNNDPADATDDSTVERDYDSLGRLLRERQNGKTIATQVDGVGNRGGAQLSERPRRADRPRRPRPHRRHPATRAARPRSPTTTYLGPGRTLERRYGNGTRLSYHDGATGRRLRRHPPHASATATRPRPAAISSPASRTPTIASATGATSSTRSTIGRRCSSTTPPIG